MHVTEFSNTIFSRNLVFSKYDRFKYKFSYSLYQNKIQNVTLEHIFFCSAILKKI